MPRHPDKSILIAGPCSVENRKQAHASMVEALQRPVDYIRLSLWKPRTQPGFDGLQEAGLPILAEAAVLGLNPATEVMMPEHAKSVMDAVLPVLGNGRLMLWIGARNQNHCLQQAIASIAAQDRRVVLMLKNQPWKSDSHWEGIAAHALAAGLPAEQLLLCHRGFAPEADNPLKLRNVPDHDAAMRVRDKTGLRMLFDPSHTAGSVEKVPLMLHDTHRHAYDGTIIEVHPNPRHALTDAAQQLTWQQLDALYGFSRKIAPERMAS